MTQKPSRKEVATIRSLIAKENRRRKKKHLPLLPNVTAKQLKMGYERIIADNLKAAWRRSIKRAK